jgi:hypothetical protein
VHVLDHFPFCKKWRMKSLGLDSSVSLDGNRQRHSSRSPWRTPKIYASKLDNWKHLLWADLSNKCFLMTLIMFIVRKSSSLGKEEFLRCTIFKWHIRGKFHKMRLFNPMANHRILFRSIQTKILLMIPPSQHQTKHRPNASQQHK